MPVAIHVGHVDGKHRRDLCLEGQFNGDEVIAAIEKNHRGQGHGPEFAGAGLREADHLRGARFAIGFVVRKTGAQKGHGRGERVQHPHGRDLAGDRISFRLNQVHSATATQVAVENPRGPLDGRRPGSVQPPVSCDNVGLPVSI